MTDKEMIVRLSVKHLTLCGLDSPYGGLEGMLSGNQSHLSVPHAGCYFISDSLLFL